MRFRCGHSSLDFGVGCSKLFLDRGLRVYHGRHCSLAFCLGGFERSLGGIRGLLRALASSSMLRELIERGCSALLGAGGRLVVVLPLCFCLCAQIGNCPLVLRHLQLHIVPSVVDGGIRNALNLFDASISTRHRVLHLDLDLLYLDLQSRDRGRVSLASLGDLRSVFSLELVASLLHVLLGCLHLSLQRRHLLLDPLFFSLRRSAVGLKLDRSVCLGLGRLLLQRDRSLLQPVPLVDCRLLRPVLA